ncbi:Uncharacterised protein [Serratia quinivorans]|nr:Uncharacterised protein [Serratia quinivorans]CAI0923662.1 Uncharacterised protein [Serratia quinivorans]CAI1712905.1 Uncharacterised protein [Serratia quinivorans]CAI2089187.1 Uncharacterised protein [Serratia quinivorans]CAI2429898.1 Uncharacterised protein [Serratia quinivorans]
MATFPDKNFEDQYRDQMREMAEQQIRDLKDKPQPTKQG